MEYKGVQVEGYFTDATEFPFGPWILVSNEMMGGHWMENGELLGRFRIEHAPWDHWEEQKGSSLAFLLPSWAKKFGRWMEFSELEHVVKRLNNPASNLSSFNLKIYESAL